MTVKNTEAREKDRIHYDVHVGLTEVDKVNKGIKVVLVSSIARNLI